MAWLPITHKEIAALSDGLSVEEQVGILEQDLRAHCDLIRDLLAGRDAASHAEILAFSLLDSLGYLQRPAKNKGGGQRIRDFIECLASCEDCTRFSVPALLSLLRTSEDTSFQALQNRCQELFDLHWDPGSLPRIQMDLSESEVLELTGGRGNLQVVLKHGVLIELGQCKHSRMLAEKRNALAHQLVKKGLRSVANVSEPHYIWRASDDAYNDDVNGNNDDNGNKRTDPDDWELVYPVKFLLNLCEDGILAACSHLREKNRAISSIAAKRFMAGWQDSAAFAILGLKQVNQSHSRHSAECISAPAPVDSICVSQLLVWIWSRPRSMLLLSAFP